ncbi:MAG: glycosyltransferase [Pseudomonadota bacterium]
MSLPPVSVVVVSRGRPEALRLCLTGLAQLSYPAFEVVVVADPQGIAAARAHAFGATFKCVPFDEPNISAARNAGIDHAAGEILAFVDDDAVPEPTWLTYLIAPFSEGRVAAAGGYVRGRNGISLQWAGRRLDALGQPSVLALPDDAARAFTPAPGTAIKTEGTNMAVRRSVLRQLGGFDPAYHFFLDETDLNMRLAAAGHATALVPKAQVHHGFAASSRRRADRVPTDLFDIGASWAVFQRKFVPQDQRRAHWLETRGSERRRLVRLMVQGSLEPRDVRRLMRRLDLGYGQGIERATGNGQIRAVAKVPFAAMPGGSGVHRVITARWRQRAKARKQAKDAVKNGAVVTLLLLSPTSLFHHARFHPDGYWEQTGGQFGRSVRTDSIFRPWRFSARAKRELSRICAIRGSAQA